MYRSVAVTVGDGTIRNPYVYALTSLSDDFGVRARWQEDCTPLRSGGLRPPRPVARVESSATVFLASAASVHVRSRKQGHAMFPMASFRRASDVADCATGEPERQKRTESSIIYYCKYRYIK